MTLIIITLNANIYDNDNNNNIDNYEYVATNVARRKITDARCIEDMFIWAQTSYASDTQACR